jgi:hypothetical protein
MAWKKRNGRRYYYRNKKINGRVLTEYIGAGRSAEIAAELDQTQRLVREAQASALRALKAKEDAIDRQITDLSQQASAVIAAELISRGYRLHKRSEWRKQRDRASSKNASSE